MNGDLLLCEGRENQTDDASYSVGGTQSHTLLCAEPVDRESGRDSRRVEQRSRIAHVKSVLASFVPECEVDVVSLQQRIGDIVALEVKGGIVHDGVFPDTFGIWTEIGTVRNDKQVG